MSFALPQQVDHVCANCTSTGMTIFYEVKQVPVHSVLLHSSQQEAVEFPKGDICLGYCSLCGFISNTSFDPNLQNYATHKYDATQAFSETFNTFHRNLALRLIDEYDLHGKRVLEIGCGQGEFLDLLCDLGENIGIGFDPAYDESRRSSPPNERVTLFKDFYAAESLQQYPVDFICCKMTLEHIHKPYEFVKMVADSVRGQLDTTVFFQVPNVQNVLQEVAFWDIYYEHCSYFSQTSLNYLFQLCGFQVIKNSVEYDGQYLMIEAKQVKNNDMTAQPEASEISNLMSDVNIFQENYPKAIDGWMGNLEKFFIYGKKVVIWGGSSKTVSFLTTLKIKNEIEFVVDINPNKHGTYLAGTGQKIVSYTFLKTYKPDLIIVMNPIYIKEIKQTLDEIGLLCQLVSMKDTFDLIHLSAQNRTALGIS